MFTTPPCTGRHVEATVRTRRAHKKELQLQNATRDVQSDILKTENMVKNNLPARPGTDGASGVMKEIVHENPASVKSYRSASSVGARKKLLEYEAAKAKAAIEAETARREAEIARRESETKKQLIEQRLAADLAALEARSASHRSLNHRHSEVNSTEKVQQWLERSHISEANCSTQQIIDGGGDIKQLVNAIHQSNSQNIQLMSRIATSKDLPQFYGDPLEWLAFKQAYDESTKFCKYSEAENMWRLRKSLRGEARETVSALLIVNTSPNTVIEALSLRYGRPEIIINKTIQQLRKLLPLSHNYHHEIVPFSIKIKNFVATVQTVKQTDYLRSPELVTTVLTKLPASLITKWADYYSTNCDTEMAKIEVLADFLFNEANKISNAGLSCIYSHGENKKRHEDRRQHAVLLSEEGGESLNCKFCRVSKHKLTECTRFKRAMTKDRWRFARSNNLCHKCLLSSHSRDACPVAACGTDGCTLPHHRLLHWKQKSTSARNTTHESISNLPVNDNTVLSDSLQNSEVVTHTYNNHKNRVLLKVVPIRVHGPQGLFSTYALLDDGATVSLISAKLANRVDLKGQKQTMCIRDAWNCELMCETQSVNCKISNLNNNKTLELSAKIISELNLPIQTLSNIDLKNYKHLSQFCNTNSVTNINVKPEILIGQDNYHLIAPIKTIIGNKNEPCATLTSLGWCIHGVCPERRHSKSAECAMITVDASNRHTCTGAAANTIPLAVAHTHTSASEHNIDSTQHTLTNTNRSECICLRRPCDTIHTDLENDKHLHELVRKSFMFESIGIYRKPRPNENELKAINMVNSTAKLVSGRWEVGLPWRDENTMMSDSYSNAYRRLKIIEKKMTSDEEYGTRYKERVYHLITNNYARRIEPKEEKNSIHRLWYLPHFGVDNPNKGKLRLVFDAAASSAGQSLNNYLLPGPNLLESLLGIMFRFREKPIGLTGDIKDMFLRIRIRAIDQHALRFLWRDSPNETIQKYAMTSLIFGANCSPFIAQHIKNKNAQRFVNQMPVAVNAIIKSHFMDDYIDCFEDPEEALTLMKQVSYIHQQGGFEIRNWTSNDLQVCMNIPKGTLSTAAVQFKVEENNKSERTLGLLWYPNADTFGFNLSMPQVPIKLLSYETNPTKRELLRIVMSIFDVYGLLAPFTINAKIIMQNTWKSSLQWDEEIKPPESDIFCNWLSQLKEIKEVRVPRWYFRSHDDGAWSTARVSETLELHVFCDASPAAYAAVAYWRARVNDDIRVSFIACRSRVAPIRPVTIPRLELQAAVLACRLATTIQLEHTLKPIKRYFWSDSTTVLHWIRNKNRSYNIFVANRLGEIDESSDTNEWYYVPTDRNIADVATKNNTYKLQEDCEWFRGPKFLYNVVEDWFTSTPEKENIEMRDCNLELINHIYETVNYDLPVPEPNKFSSWLRLLRCTATMLLFIEKCKKTCKKEIDAEILKKAEILLLRYSQAQSFAIEIKLLRTNKSIQPNSRLRTLTPYLDELGLLRVGGRVEAASNVTIDVKRPIILDGRHSIARLITKMYHVDFAHGNNETVINELRQKYWLLNLRPTVRSVVAKCNYCRIRRAKPFTPRMADLPEARLAHNVRPFSHCGVDLFGPMEVTVCRRKEKRYGVLFTCMTIRAVHIELVPSLTTDSFIMALRRMACRRGWPQNLYSDNGTNLHGAEKELQKSYEDLNQPEIRHEISNRGVTWSFNSPHSPHKGGAWERLIRSVKTALRVVLRERTPKEETLATLLIEVENIVNSRPLTHVSVDPGDMEALTPNHFLIGSTSNLPIPGVFDDGDLYVRKMWRTAQRLADMFWQRWVKEVLPTLIPRQKWFDEDKNLKPGDLVIIIDPNLPRNTWPKGVIETVYPGRDGRIRTARVKTKTGLLIRPATRLALLPTSE